MRKGIILAGGANTRLYPLTLSVCKQLLPVYDKPMIFYPMSTLLDCGCEEILIITRSERDQCSIMELFPPALFGVKLTYTLQPSPLGLADAFRIANRCDFIRAQDRVMLILGDNLFDGVDIRSIFRRAVASGRAHAFFQHVANPQWYGVGKFNELGDLVDIVEKPKDPPSRWAQTGFYIYDHNVVQIANDLKPSARGELEITDVNVKYLEMGALRHTRLSRGCCWFDMGTPDSLMEAAEYVRTLQKRQGMLIGCPAMAALRSNLTDKDRVAAWAHQFHNEYGDELRSWLKSGSAVPLFDTIGYTA